MTISHHLSTSLNSRNIQITYILYIYIYIYMLCATPRVSKCQNVPGRKISRFQCLRRAHGFSPLAKDEVSYMWVSGAEWNAWFTVSCSSCRCCCCCCCCCCCLCFDWFLLKPCQLELLLVFFFHLLLLLTFFCTSMCYLSYSIFPFQSSRTGFHPYQRDINGNPICSNLLHLYCLVKSVCNIALCD